jgi:hypothetical protein
LARERDPKRRFVVPGRFAAKIIQESGVDTWSPVSEATVNGR